MIMTMLASINNSNNTNTTNNTINKLCGTRKATREHMDVVAPGMRTHGHSLVPRVPISLSIYIAI